MQTIQIPKCSTCEGKLHAAYTVILAFPFHKALKFISSEVHEQTLEIKLVANVASFNKRRALYVYEFPFIISFKQQSLNIYNPALPAPSAERYGSKYFADSLASSNVKLLLRETPFPTLLAQAKPSRSAARTFLKTTNRAEAMFTAERNL